MPTTSTHQNTGQTLTQERTDLLASLAHARHFLRLTARDLTTEQAGAHPTSSVLCVGGLIKHVTAVEKHWADFIVHGAAKMPKDFSQWTEEDFAAREREFQMQPGETLDGVLAGYEQVAQQTDEMVRTVASLDQLQELPKAPWNTEEAWTVRRVLLHIVAETAQHAGHADIIREAIDGSKSMG